jgi:hypothetical protein
MTFVPKPNVCQPSGSAELAMLDVYMPMMKSAAIISAGRLGLFEALAKGPLPLPELAAKIQSSLQGTATLADFLVVIGYLEKQGECIANTASTQRWFTSEGQVNYTSGLLWTHEAWPMMGALAEAVRSGTPGKTLWDAMVEKPHLGQLFSAYMAAFATDLGPDLLEHVPIEAHASTPARPGRLARPALDPVLPALPATQRGDCRSAQRPDGNGFDHRASRTFSAHPLEPGQSA